MRKSALIMLLVLVNLFMLGGCAQEVPTSETKALTGKEPWAIMQEEREEQSEGRYILVEECYEYSDSTVHRRYVFDENCKILEAQYEEVEDGKSDTSSEVYSYNADGNPEEVLLYIDGEVSQRYLCECNENGQVERLTIYNGDGEPINLFSYAYDENGYKIESITYPNYPDLDRIKQTCWVYDNAGILLQREDSDNGQIYAYWEYTYDEANGLKEILRWTEYDRKEYYTAEVKCDNNGHPLWMIWYNENGEETGVRYEFSYDANGNKVKEWYYEDERLVYTATFRYEKMESSARGIFGE